MFVDSVLYLPAITHYWGGDNLYCNE